MTASATVHETALLNYIKENIETATGKNANGLKKKDNKGVLLFFNASWCKPCGKIKRLVAENKNIIDKQGIKLLYIDIDTSKDQYQNEAEFYSFLKRKRIIKGVPSLLLYLPDNKTIYPDFFCESNNAHFEALINIIKEI